MKNIKVVILVAILALCGMGLHAQSAEFTPTTKGYALEAPVDTAKFAKCAKVALLRNNWIIDSIESGAITAHFEKSNGLIRAVIKVTFNSEAYSIVYVDSKNLDVDLKYGYIHRNYVRWVSNLNKNIYTLYLTE